MTLVVYELFTLNFLGCSTGKKSGAKVYIARAKTIVKLLFVGRGYFSTFQPVPSVKLTRFWSTFLVIIQCRSYMMSLVYAVRRCQSMCTLFYGVQ